MLSLIHISYTRKGLMNVFLHETFSCICMCRKPGILPLFDNADVYKRQRKDYPQYKILLTFYSPSGYEVRKNYEGAEDVYKRQYIYKKRSHEEKHS